MESCSSNPQAEILFNLKRHPSELRRLPKSLAIDLIYVPAEHLIFISMIPFILSHLIKSSSSIFTSLGANSKFSLLKDFF